MDVQKLSKGPLLHFSSLCDLPETKKFEKKDLNKSLAFIQFFPHAGTVEENISHHLTFEVLLLFLRLRYGADLGRSRLVLFYE